MCEATVSLVRSLPYVGHLSNFRETIVRFHKKIKSHLSRIVSGMRDLVGIFSFAEREIEQIIEFLQTIERYGVSYSNITEIEIFFEGLMFPNDEVMCHVSEICVYSRKIRLLLNNIDSIIFDGVYNKIIWGIDENDSEEDRVLYSTYKNWFETVKDEPWFRSCGGGGGLVY